MSGKEREALVGSPPNFHGTFLSSSEAWRAMTSPPGGGEHCHPLHLTGKGTEAQRDGGARPSFQKQEVDTSLLIRSGSLIQERQCNTEDRY